MCCLKHLFKEVDTVYICTCKRCGYLRISDQSVPLMNVYSLVLFLYLHIIGIMANDNYFTKVSLTSQRHTVQLSTQ